MGKVLAVALTVLAIGLTGCANMEEPPPPDSKTVEIRVPDVKTPAVVTPKVTKPAVPKVTPKVTPPKVETPKVTPKVTPPKVETPKVTPKVTPPKVETPAVPKVTKPVLKVSMKDIKPGFAAVDLTAVYNNDGMAAADKLGDSDFDEWKQGFPAETMPKAGLFEAAGAAFTFPAKDAGKKNNVICAGQTIALAGKAKCFKILATATGANQEAKITVAYADGVAQLDLKVTDWCADAAFGEKVGIESAKRIAVDDAGKLATEDKKCRIWVVTIPVDAKRELKSVKLPDNGGIHIFALTVAK
ncbi:hypothetical protein HQ560_09730 [bacterium]|nr:hypothetical protein [bacterium]